MRATLPFLTLCVVCGGLAPAQAPPSASGLDASRLARIPQRMRQFVDAATISGAVTLVARHGVVAELDAVGYQDVGNKTPMKPDTIFQIMSMTKPFTGVGIMMLFEEGKLGVDDPVYRYLPEFRGQKVADGVDPEGTPHLREPARPVTIKDLMTHTSGIPDPSEDAQMEATRQMRLPLAEVVAQYAAKPLNFDPGSKWQYSSPGIAVLGRIIEVVSGQPYEQFIAARLLRPLGMTDSFFFPPEDKRQRIAMVYHRENGKLVRSQAHLLGGNPSDFRPGARYPAPEWGLYSTASDLLAFYQMMLGHGTYQGRRYLSRPTVDLMRRSYTDYLPRAGWLGGGGYGLTWEVAQNPPGTFLLHSPGTYGHGGAFGTQGWIDPQYDLIRILLVQTSDDADAEVNRAFMAMAAAAIID